MFKIEKLKTTFRTYRNSIWLYYFNDSYPIPPRIVRVSMMAITSLQAMLAQSRSLQLTECGRNVKETFKLGPVCPDSLSTKSFFLTCN